jgi:hypothetical protein
VTTGALDLGWQRERNWLGYAGLLPFLGSATMLLLDADPAHRLLAVDVLRYYAAVIASFLGAVHWGAAAGDPSNRRARLRWGVMPALIAWTLLLVPPNAAFIGFAALFAAVFYVDWRLLPLLDSHYRQLRLQLSVVVIATLLVAAFAPGVPA